MTSKIHTTVRISSKNRDVIYDNGYNPSSALKYFAEMLEKDEVTQEENDNQQVIKILDTIITDYTYKLQNLKDLTQKLQAKIDITIQEYENIEYQKKAVAQLREERLVQNNRLRQQGIEACTNTLRGNYTKRERIMGHPRIKEQDFKSMCENYNLTIKDVLTYIDPKYHPCLENYEKYVSKVKSTNKEDNGLGYLDKLRNATIVNGGM